MARVLVTDSDNRSALAAVRSLGRRGHTVFSAGARFPSLAGVSRYSAGFTLYPDPSRNPEAFVEAIARIAAERQADVLLPMTEITTLLTTQHSSRLPLSVAVPFPAYANVRRANDKAEVLSLAADLGVPTPNTVVVNTPEDVMPAAEALPWPIVIKPSRSRVWDGHRWLSEPVKYAHSAQQLAELVKRVPRELFPLLLQERIEGPGIGLFACRGRDRLIATFAHRRIREKPPSGGVSVLSESTPVDPLALDYGERLLRALDWQGVAMVEFKRDLRDGSLKLMEINGRFWGSLQLAVDAGVDFPSMAVALALGERFPDEQPGYRAGVRCRWLWGDVDSTLALLLRSRQRLNLPPHHPGKLRTLLDFMRFWRPGLRYELERFDDVRPALLAARRWMLRQT